MPSNNPKISIAVWEGDPVDFQKYRHTGVLIRFDDDDSDSRNNIFVHIVGPSGLFSFQSRQGYNPEASTKLSAMVPVGRSLKPVTASQMLTEAQNTAINNADLEWNCQNWVHDFLKRLSEKGIISSAQYLEAFDAMVVETMNAKHEPQQ